MYMHESTHILSPQIVSTYMNLHALTHIHTYYKNIRISVCNMIISVYTVHANMYASIYAVHPHMYVSIYTVHAHMFISIYTKHPHMYTSIYTKHAHMYISIYMHTCIHLYIPSPEPPLDRAARRPYRESAY